MKRQKIVSRARRRGQVANPRAAEHWPGTAAEATRAKRAARITGVGRRRGYRTAEGFQNYRPSRQRPAGAAAVATPARVVIPNVADGVHAAALTRGLVWSAVAVHAPELPGTPEAGTARARILVIDDESGIRDVVAEVLQDEGYAVDTAPNGAAALALLNKPGQPAPDLILLDMRMPEMNGWEFAEAYRQRPGPHAPIATLTAAIDASRYAAEIGADGFLGKPFEVDALLALVERLSSQR